MSRKADLEMLLGSDTLDPRKLSRAKAALVRALGATVDDSVLDAYARLAVVSGEETTIVHVIGVRDLLAKRRELRRALRRKAISVSDLHTHVAAICHAAV